MSAKRLLLGLVALPLLGAAAPKSTSLDLVAQDYVRLTLEAGVREPEYVDAYYGPPEWAAAAKAHTRSVERLEADAASLRVRAERVPLRVLSALEGRRRAFLIGQLAAAETRLAMHRGKRFSFADEAKGLFGVRPALSALSSYDGTLQEIDRLVPGKGPLWQRVDEYRNRFVIPSNRLDAVVRAAIAECRRRTLTHIALPKEEKFGLEFVTGKPWSAYNYYKGHSTSVIQVNTDLPLLVDRAVDLGCHEGYPGHHVYNSLLERELARGRGWVEFTIYPLYSPESFIAEGSANYGIDLAFRADEREQFEAKTLFTLAGLDPAEAPRFAALSKALQKLSGARFAIAQEYLDGRVDRATALALTQRYSLLSEARAAKSLEFDDHYRSYVINYGLGKEAVRRDVEAAGPTLAAKWQEMARILSQPTSPADLTR